MRKQDGDVEMIEVFAPDDATFWSDGSSAGEITTAPPTGRGSRRGVVTIGLLAFVGAIAGAVALTDDPNSESATTTTIAATPTTQRALLDPTTPTHFVIDDPTLTAYSADIVTPPASGRQVQVWTDGTSFGPIVIVELHPHAYEPYGIVGAARDVVDGVEVVRAKAYCPPSTEGITSHCEKLTSEVAIDDDWSVTVLATRVGASSFAAIVNEVRVVDGKLATESAVMAALELGLTFEDESLDELIFGRVESAVRYLTDDGQIATLRSAVGVADQQATAIRYLATNGQPSFYGRTYGYLWTSDESIVVWEDQGRLLSLVGPIDAAELSVISRQARAATTGEWQSMLYGLRPDYTLGDFASVATGHDASSEPWRAGPQIAQRAGRTEFLWWWTVPGLTDVTASTAASRSVGTRPNVDTLVVPGATFVFITSPKSGGVATVRTPTGVEYLAELVQPFSQSTVYMTVVRIEEPGPVTVSIDGVEVAG